MFREELHFLSNFYPQTFYCTALDKFVPTSEHAFMALKSVDPEEQKYVLEATTPNAAKKRGREITLRPDWDSGARVWAMREVLTDKFTVPDMKRALLATGDLRLVEENTWHDQFWGDCSCSKHQDVAGTNMLGELLMAFRTQLRQ